MCEVYNDIWLERTMFVGGFFEALLYGVQIIIYSMCLYYLIGRRKERMARWQLLYITALFGSGTINVAANTNYRQLAWIEDRDTYCGGPAGFLADQWSIPVSLASSAAFAISNFLADGLMLWRCNLVWSGKIWIMLLPFLAWLATTAMSILSFYTASQPNSNLDDAYDFTVPYLALSMSTNLVLSLLIAGRALWMRRKVVGALGAEHAKAYTSVISMIVESSALYSIVGMTFLITYALHSHAQYVLLPVHAQIMCISTELIVLRVAHGRAWSRRVIHQTTSMNTSMNTSNVTPRKRRSHFTTTTDISASFHDIAARNQPQSVINLKPIDSGLDTSYSYKGDAEI